MTPDLIKCDICGRFVSLADLISGKAERYLLTPDSDYSAEDYETYHMECYRETERQMRALRAKTQS